ncbi:G-protein coupled receptor family C group 6 member A-like [Hyla sarda]|uniref:G-protein coupled receptor family C group 6 member A-like n=1 Tax=Hyla sarda TaxID=327740 RepID=UPI0024C23271|nr:G-protein coupled receptor family C group 6 member A-like [Hyla sarda]
MNLKLIHIRVLCFAMGFYVSDSCTNANKAVKSTIQILSGPGATVPNYYCTGEENIAGFIGDLLSVTTIPIAQLLNLYGYTQISYGATDPLLSDRTLYPYLLRTSHSDHVYFSAIIRLLKHFSWSWVGIVTSADNSGIKESESLSTFLHSQDICVEFIATIFSLTTIYGDINIKKILNINEKNKKIISSSSSNIILICGTLSFYIADFLQLPDYVLKTKTFILPPSWFTNNEILEQCFQAFNSCLGFFYYMKAYIEYNGHKELLINPYHTEKIKQFLKNLHPGNFPDNKMLEDIWMTHALCLSTNEEKNRLFEKLFNVKLHNCSNEENIIGFPYTLFTIVSPVVYNALLSMAYALDAMIKFMGKDFYKNKINSHKYRHKVPRSQCSENCPPGSRKIKNNKKPICCYDCVMCSEGEISNITDSENCIKCLPSEWSSNKRDRCLPKLEEFLAYSDRLAITLLTFALLFWTLSVLILGIFVSHKDTPIVKANNMDLSFILLISLSFCFLCVFLFVGRPVHIICKFRQIVFGIIFSISVSSILAKTIMVYTAFKTSRPGSPWRKLMGKKMSTCIVVLASSIEVIISIIWLYFSPPYLEQDTHSYQRRIIIQCNEGSHVGFFAVLGYLFFLAAISFTVAYLARTLPDRFNEAKYITFSMLVFCSVWITMVPSYLSTKGKNMVAVHIFSVLASSAGLLGFIFFPKCYIILLKPEMNARRHLQKKVLRHNKLFVKQEKCVFGVKEVQKNLRNAQELQRKSANKRHTCGIKFKVGDKVWLSTNNLRLKVPSKKLASRFIGPREVYNVFHCSLLKLYSPTLSPVSVPPPPVEIDGKLEYELRHFMKFVRFERNIKFEFNNKGEISEPLKIYNDFTIEHLNDTMTKFNKDVGTFKGSLPQDRQLNITPSDMVWINNKVPKSQCSEQCSPGYRKVVKEGAHICCYDCILCSEGQMSNMSDLASTTLTKHHLLKLLLETLKAKNLQFRWLYPFDLSLLYKRILVLIHTSEDLETAWENLGEVVDRADSSPLLLPVRT